MSLSRRERLERAMKQDYGGQVPYDAIDDDLIAAVEQAERGGGSAITPGQDGTLAIGKFRLTSTGISIEGEFTEEEADRLGEFLAQLDESRQWWFGDWANSYIPADASKDDVSAIYQRLADKFGLEANTIKNYAYVARNVPASIRIDALSFTHHRLVVGRDEMQELLQWAEDTGASVAGLRQHIKDIDAPPSPPASMPDVEVGRFADDTPSTLPSSMPNDEWVGKTIVLQNGLAGTVEREIEGWLGVVLENGNKTSVWHEDARQSSLREGLVVAKALVMAVGQVAVVMRDLSANERDERLFAKTVDYAEWLLGLTYEKARGYKPSVIGSQISEALKHIAYTLEHVQSLMERATAEGYQEAEEAYRHDVE